MATNQYVKYPANTGGGSGVSSLNTLTGDVILAAGSNITLTPVGNTITISSTGGGGSGTVTSVSVVTANGLAGTVATATTTPAITLSTTVTGILQGNGTAISATPTTGAGNVVLSTSPTLTGTITATAANFSGAITASNFSGSSSGTNTGDVTLAAFGSVPNANGLSLSGQVLNLQPFDSTHPGGVPASGGGTTNFLRADGTFAAPAGTSGITALTGDVTATGPGSVPATLATVNANVGSFGSASSVAAFTVNAKGLTTAASSIAIQIAESQVTNLVSDLAGKQPVGNYITDLTGDATASGPGSVPITLATVNGNVGSFGSSTSIPSFTVNAKGLITAASGNVVIAPAGTLTGTTLASNVVTSSLTSLGIQSQALNMGSHLINAVTDPVSAQDAATKNYVDTVASGLQPIQAVYAATTGSNISGTYLNGAAGIGATFTTTSTATFTVDGVTPPLASRVLIKDQTSGFQNGVYNVTQIATGILPTIFTRALDYNTSASINAGDLIPVINGTVNGLTSWLQTATVTTVGTDPLVFVEWTANPANYLLKANNLSDVASLSTSFNNISPMTTAGDIIYENATPSGTRLPIGSSGQVLTVVSGLPAWSAASVGTVTSVALTVPAFLSVSGSPITSSGTLAVSLSGTALPVPNGGTGDTSFTANQVILGGTTSTGPLTQVPGGTSGYILTSNGVTAAPTFQPAPGTVSAFYASNLVNTASTAIGSTTYVTFSNSPAFTFTPSITGTYKITCNIPIDNNGTGNSAFARIFNTTGGGTLLFNSDANLTGISSEVEASLPMKNYYTLIANTSYVFDIQGKVGAGSVTCQGTDNPFYMFAELETTGSLPLQVSSINSLSGAITLAAGTNTTIVPTGNTLTFNSAGSVSSVALADASTSSIYTVSGSPITSTGTLTLTLNTQSANTVFAGPTTGSPAQPGFRALVNSDVSTLTVANVSASSNSTLTTLSALSLPTSQLSGTVSLTAQVSGVLPIANGGTNNGTLPVTAGGVIYTDGTKLQNVGAGTAGYVLTSNGASPPTWNASGGGGGTFQFFASSQVTTDSGNITSSSFTTFNNSPALSFTPTVSGTYKIYCSLPLENNNGTGEAVARIVDTGANATLLYESQGAMFSSGGVQVTTMLIQSVYTLIASTSYTFDVQGKVSGGGSINNTGGSSPFYMFAEQCG